MTAINKSLMPQFEHQQRPQRHRVVATTTFMLIEQNVRVRSREDAAFTEPRISQRIANTFSQLLIDPLLNRHAEALLGSRKNLFRHKVRNRSLEQMLRF